MTGDGDLETRLHRAAGALRRSVADVPVGEAPRAHSAGSVVLGVGVGVAVGALALTALATWRGGSDDLATQPVADVQALVASELPGGLEIAWAGRQRGAAAANGQVDEQLGSSRAAAAGGSIDTYLYGARPDGEDDNGDGGGAGGGPFATSDLVIEVRRGAAATADAQAGVGGSGLPVTVRGRAGQVEAAAGLTILRWVETTETTETTGATEASGSVTADAQAGAPGGDAGSGGSDGPAGTGATETTEATGAAEASGSVTADAQAGAPGGDAGSGGSDGPAGTGPIGATEVVLASRTLTSDQLVALASGLAIDGGAVTLGAPPPDLPGPLNELGHLAHEATGSAAGQAVNWVGYVDPADPQGRVVDVTTLTGGTSELLALVWQLDADQLVDVRGRQAWLAASAPGVDPSTPGTLVDLVWQEASGVLVHVTALGLSEPEVRQVTGGLRPASDQEWDEIETTVEAGVTAGEGGAGDGAGAGAPGDATTAGPGTAAGTGGGATTSSTDTETTGTEAGAGATTGDPAELDQIEAEIHGRLGVGPLIDLVEALGGGLAEGLGAGSAASGGTTSTSPAPSVPAGPDAAETDMSAHLEPAP